MSTKNKTFSKYGIIAYGSLIKNSGEEIEQWIRGRIKIITPFNVEFKRKSSTRNNSPTLVPVQNSGSKVRADLLILDESLTESEIKSMLYRREKHTSNKDLHYIEPTNPNINSILVKMLLDFKGFQKVFYTEIGQNITEPVTGKKLAELAIESILGDAGHEKEDGIRYLKEILDCGIKTPLTKEYVNSILQLTNTNDLDKSIELLDKMRDSK